MIRPFQLITVVARDLGLDPRKGRLIAKWRGGKNYSVSLSDEKGCWRDHVTGESGSIIALVMKALGCDNREAKAWLGRQYGWPQPDPAMRSRRAQARSESENLAAFVNRLRETVFEIRNAILTEWHLAEWAARGPERAGDLPACEWRRLRARLKLADQLDAYVTHVEQLPAAELIALRARLIEVPA